MNNHSFARFFCQAALLVALASVPCSFARPSSGQQPSPRKTVLPQKFGKWTGYISDAAFEEESWRRHFAVLSEVGYKYSEHGLYKSGEANLEIGLKRFHDPSSAYEIYTALLTPDMHPSTVWGPSAIGNDRLFLLIGDLILDIREPSKASTEELQELAKFVRGHADQTPLPPVRTYLAEGFADGTQRYVLGPFGFQEALESLHQSAYSVLTPEVGFQSGAEAMLAQYRRGKESAALVLILYPTPQLAEQHLRHLESVLPLAARQAGAKIERNASLLSLILAPSSAAYATDLRNSINYATQVTWNEPTHTITDPPLTTTIAKIILATFLLMVIAVVLVIAFGGVRLLTKIFFPGKVFDRPDQLDVLQLGLSSKRIDSRDFY